jgi:protein-disulfide isomerase
MPKTTEKKEVPMFMPGGIFQAVVVLVLVVGAVFLGSLWTKVQYLEKGGAPTAGTAPTDVQGTPAPAAAAVAPKVDKNKDHIRGDKNARIALVEYSDLECPFCKQFHLTAKQILEEYKGKVMWIYRDYPLSFHANAQKESEASECVASLGGEDAYWKYIDAIYERTTSNGTGFALDSLAPLAGEVGVDQSAFQNCLDKGQFTQKVKDELAQGTKEGVTGTPGNILLDTKTGKTQLIPGAIPFDQIKPMIDGMLK